MIVDPAANWGDLSFHRNLDLETVTMHTPAFMTLRRARQSLRRLKSEILGQACSHVAENIMTATALSSRSRSRGRGTSHRPMRLFSESKLTQASIVRSFALLRMTAEAASVSSNSALRGSPDELVHLQLKAN